jgi:hypothetical protein
MIFDPNNHKSKCFKLFSIKFIEKKKTNCKIINLGVEFRSFVAFVMKQVDIGFFLATSFMRKK